jgi:glycosyltransferase involved in cell wall biosynthesis
MNNKILMLSDSNIDEDERIQKTCESLVEMGFTVDLIFPSNKSNHIFHHPNLTLISFSYNKFLYNKLLATCLLHPFYWLYMIRKVKNKCNIKEYSIIYAHDLPLAGLGSKIRPSNCKILISDQHELYSDYIANSPKFTGTLGKIVIRLSNWKKFEKNVLLMSDLVITVHKELQEEYHLKYGIPNQKIVVLPNTPKRYYDNDQIIDDKVIKKYLPGKQSRVIFIASRLTKERNIEMIINSIPKIKQTIPDFKFMLLGEKHPSYDLDSHVRSLNLENTVEHIGLVPSYKLISYLKCSSIGLNIHNIYAGKAIHNTILTKFYLYLSQNLPIITSNLIKMAEMVEKNKIGFIVEQNPDDLADKIITLLSNKELLEKLKENTTRVKDVFWENTSNEWKNAMLKARNEAVGK